MLEKSGFVKFPFIKIFCHTVDRLPITICGYAFLNGDNSINIETVLSLWSDWALYCSPSQETQKLFFSVIVQVTTRHIGRLH